MSEKTLGASERTACSCGNVCNRSGRRRGACPCLTEEKFCTAACNCGVAKMGCTNRPGIPESVLSTRLGLHEEAKNDGNYGSEEEETDTDTEPAVLVVRFEGENISTVTVPDDADLDSSLQELADDPKYAVSMPDVGTEQGSPDVSRENEPQPCSGDTATDMECPADDKSVFSDWDAGRLKKFAELAIERFPELLELAEIPVSSAGTPPPPQSPEPGFGAPEWCHCGNCRQMPTLRERLCCRKRPGQCLCISSAQELQEIVLHRGVLEVALNVRNDIFVYANEPNNRNLRYVAYRQYVVWKYGYLGKGNRVVIPSCVTWRIRDTFPEPDGTYVGFTVGRLQ